VLYSVLYWECVSSVYFVSETLNKDILLIEADNVQEARKIFLKNAELWLMQGKRLPRKFNGDQGLLNVRLLDFKEKEIAVTFHKKDVLRSGAVKEKNSRKWVCDGSNTQKLLNLKLGESCVLFPKKGSYVTLMRTLGGDKLRLGVTPERDFAFAKALVVYPTDEKMVIGVCVTRTK